MQKTNHVVLLIFKELEARHARFHSRRGPVQLYSAYHFSIIITTPREITRSYDISKHSTQYARSYDYFVYFPL